MSFEFFRKRLRRQWWSPQFDGKAVPCGRARHSKVSLTDRSPGTWHDECPAVSRPQLPPADDRRNADALYYYRRCKKSFWGTAISLQVSWVEYGIMSNLTHYRSFLIWSSQPISWLIQNTHQPSQPITWLILTKTEIKNINKNLKDDRQRFCTF